MPVVQQGATGNTSKMEIQQESFSRALKFKSCVENKTRVSLRIRHIELHIGPSLQVGQHMRLNHVMKLLVVQHLRTVVHLVKSHQLVSICDGSDYSV